VSNIPEGHTYAAVVVIIAIDDEGAISLDRYSFAPGLTEPLIKTLTAGPDANAAPGMSQALVVPRAVQLKMHESLSLEVVPWPERSSFAPSPIAMWARSATWTMARRR